MALLLGPAVALGASYHSPGYRGTHRIPRVVAPPPPAPAIVGTGADPHLLVDAAGTAHVTWSENPSGGDSVIHYCRLPRGQRQCAVQQTAIPPDNDSGFGNGPSTDIDFYGPWPLAVGNELLILDHRCCNSVPMPDGGSSSDVNFLYTSEDAGASPLGSPGIVGTQVPSGNALVYGGDNPQIGIVSDTQTGGTFFQGTPAGTFTRTTANLGNIAPDAAYGGRVVLDQGQPITAFSDLSGHIYIRKYSGSGDPNDPANWSLTQTPGWQPRLVGGPGGTWLAYTQSDLNEGPWFVRPVVAGGAAGAPVQITSGNESLGYFTFAESSGGELIGGWVDRAANPQEVRIRTSSDGTHWAPEQILASGPISGALSLGATADGGGYAVFQERAPQGPDQIAVAPFGTPNANGQKGLGNLDGQGAGGVGGDQFASASCTDVHFGAIDALAEAGCFLRDPRNPTSGAAVTTGPIRLNGLEVIPDAGTRIVINPRLHTIDTTGAVSVNLHAPVFGDVTLWHGELHVDLAGGLAGVGQTLFDFDTSQFAVGLKGFPIEGKIDVEIQHDAVVIPISLKLPSYMGGVSGAATLKADNVHGLDLTSLHLGVDDLMLGALEIKNLHIDYTESGDVWAGGATLNIPGGTPYFGIDVQVEFDHGEFTMGSFHVGLPFPGVPIFTDAYLSGFGGGFDIRPPRKRFFGSIDVGAIPLDPPNYAVNVTGVVSITFLDNGPVILEVDGFGAIHGFRVASAKLLFRTDGYFEVDGQLHLDLDVVSADGSLSSFVDLPRREFSAEFSTQVAVVGFPTVGMDIVVSNVGVAGCGALFPGHLGFVYRWGDGVDLLKGLGGCDLSAYVVHPVAHITGAGGAHVAQAGVPIAPGTVYEDIAVRGAGGPPRLTLTSPDGRRITPAAVGSRGAPVVAFATRANRTTYVMLAHPQAGNWMVTQAAGSRAITEVKAARGFANPSVHARVTGRGYSRRLRYQVPVRSGLQVSFAEKGSGVYHVIGSARGHRGALHFKPAAGSGGPRVIYALLSQDGLPFQRIAVAHYSAPPPPSAGRIHHVRVRVHGKTFKITFGHSAHAQRYLVRVIASDGRHLVRVMHSPVAIALTALGYSDRVNVTVAGISETGRVGPSSRAHGAWVSRVLDHARHPHKRRHRHRRR